MDTFANLEHIDQLKNVLLPRVRRFSEQLDSYTEDNILMKSIVQQFDVTISLKCNREALDVFEDRILQKFISYDEYRNITKSQRILEQKSMQLLDDLQKEFDMLKTKLDQRIDGNCERIVRTKF